MSETNNPSIMKWCLGFILSSSFRNVLMIKKSRSLYAGFWNGVGGKLEPNEGYYDSMVRECKEETGLSTSASNWIRVADLASPGNWNVKVFGLIYEEGSYHGTSLANNAETLLFGDLSDIAPEIPTFIPISYTYKMSSMMAPYTGVLVQAAIEVIRNKTPLLTIHV